MSSKRKGTRYERELLHLFYDNGFMPVRIAGSGNVSIPSVDLIVGKSGVVYAIECKSIKKGTKYVDKEKVNQLVEFANNFGATPLVGMRFDRKGWFFLNIDDLRDSGNCFAINIDDAQEKGKSFEKLVGKSKKEIVKKVNGETIKIAGATLIKGPKKKREVIEIGGATLIPIQD